MSKKEPVLVNFTQKVISEQRFRPTLIRKWNIYPNLELKTSFSSKKYLGMSKTSKVFTPWYKSWISKISKVFSKNRKFSTRKFLNLTERNFSARGGCWWRRFGCWFGGSAEQFASVTSSRHKNQSHVYKKSALTCRRRVVFSLTR